MNDLMKNLPDLSGKCITINIMDDEMSHDLHNPHFEIQGGRLFVIGTVPVGATTSNWVANCQSAIAWERVTDYYIFDNIEAYTEAIKISEKFDNDDEHNLH